MNELRDILYSADENSIVLADELAIGTETTSALSIVSSAIKLLCDKKVSFICTSHLHQLNKISIVQSDTEESSNSNNLDIDNSADTIPKLTPNNNSSLDMKDDHSLPHGSNY